MAIEIYDITTDLSDQDIYASVLHQDALDAGLSTLTSVDANAAGNSNKVRFHFPSPLSGPDKTTLDGVVAAYDPASTQPVLDSTAAVILEDVGASANERVWALTTDTVTGTAKFGTCSDAGAPSDAAWEATRTGETVGLFDVKVPMAVAGEVTASDPTSGPALTTKTFMEGYVDARVQGINWQDAVISESLTTPPGSPTLGDRYLIPTGATGAWATNVDDLTEWDDVEWVMTTPVDGMTVPINDIGRTRRHNGTTWGSLGSTIDHGNTIGLGDDDHTQYHTDARGDARYFQIGQSLTLSGVAPLLVFDDTDADVDEKLWHMRTVGGNFELVAVDDVAGEDVVFSITRTGADASRFEMMAPLDLNLNRIEDVKQIFLRSNDDPLVRFTANSVVAADEKVWMFRMDETNSDLRIGTATNANVYTSDAIRWTRTGTTVDLCTIGSDLTVSGNIALTGTVDGRDVAADGTAQDTHIAATANPHGTDIENLGSGTLAELNAAVTDATLDTSSASRTPTSHASSHSDGGSDEITIENLATSGASGKVPTSNGSGGLTMETPAGGVFGSEWRTEELMAEQTNSTTTPSSLARIPPVSGNITLPAGTYRIEISSVWKAGASAYDVRYSLEQGGTLMTTAGKLKMDAPGTNDPRPMYFKIDKVLSAGDYNFEFLFDSSSSSGTAKSSDNQLSIFRIV